jgi:VCBS repeat-containing protein
MSGSTTFNYTGSIVTYTVPATGLYDITAFGAQGGDFQAVAEGATGGLGAEVGGDVMLTQGETLDIAVGGAGQVTISTGGGGGGSFVVGPNNTPLMIAGGGGGAAGYYLSIAGPGLTGTAGGAGQAIAGDGGVKAGAGGTNGSGGGAGNGGFYGGGGGGGFRSNGGNVYSFFNHNFGGGASFANGLAGGPGSGGVYSSAGGFGGGGSGYNGNGSGGGGGGYSGGGGGDVGYGGGGGSFDSGTNQVLVAGENSGNGLVTITPVSVTNNPPPQPVTIAEGQTTANLYSTLVNDVEAANSGAPVTITTLGLSNTMGFAYLDTADSLLTYTADGFQPGAKQPQDSFTYTASDGATCTVQLTVTGANEPTQVGATLTASRANTRLIGTTGNDTLNANAAGTAVFAGQGDDAINVNAAKAVVHGGTGTNTINLGNTAQDSIVLQQGGTDNITGLNLHNDVLDLRQVLAEAQISLGGDFSKLSNYVQVTDSGNDATMSLTTAGQIPNYGATVAVLHGVGPNVTLNTLINDHALAIT